ncbi:MULTISPECIES: hypothetical protein [Sediminibacillus]|uniref:hypothetical protein n=1 Tax=Sediminibacillus TaxID=482460 RepID=UPI0004118F96|nr:hypothetical protein [Sediminibacillus terrae]
MANFNELLLWTFMIIQMAIIFLLARLVGSYITKLNQLEANMNIKLRGSNVTEGDVAPAFREYDHRNAIVTLRADKNAVLLFLQPSCSKCKEILSYIKEQTTLGIDVFIFSKEEMVQNSAHLSEQIHLVTSETVIKNYGITDFPAVLTIENGRIIEKMLLRTNVEEFSEIVGERYFKAS